MYPTTVVWAELRYAYHSLGFSYTSGLDMECDDILDYSNVKDC
jgi:hypothetical protein